MRTSRDEWFLDLAERCAKQGTCLRRKFGAVIVDTEGTVVSTGYNGAPRGEKDCLEIARCWREENNIPSGSNYEKCRSVHAEMNACLQAGKSAREATIYLVGLTADGKPINAAPCALCTRILINSGISRVVMRESDGLFSECSPKALQDDHDKEIFGED